MSKALFFVNLLLKKGRDYMHYDYLIVGSGLFGSVVAHELKKKGKSVLVLEKRSHIGGNIYCENKDGIEIHKYGAHIFHTSDKEVWKYVNQFSEFNNYVNSPVANFSGELYNLPFNMNTFTKLWADVITPSDALKKIESERKEMMGVTPTNLEEQAISLVGRTIYEKLIKGYTEKQWGRECRELPAFIIKRLPVRFTFDNNYFNDLYQGIPTKGYNSIIEKLLSGVEVKLDTDFLSHKKEYLDCADKIIYTGMIDEYYDYSLGTLEYRSLRFETEKKEMENYQGNAVINYTDSKTPYTRIIEHKHFLKTNSPVTYITREYPSTWHKGDMAYYPMNDEKNNNLYVKYKELASKEDKVIFGGRLGEYKYYDMDKTIRSALDLVKTLD